MYREPCTVYRNDVWYKVSEAMQEGWVGDMKGKMLTKEKILEKLRESKEILRKYGVKRIGMFGSYLRGDQKKGSDIDLVVEFDREIFGRDFKGLFDAFVDLSSYIERLFNRKVDILTPDSIRTIRVKEVAKEIERSIVYA